MTSCGGPFRAVSRRPEHTHNQMGTYEVVLEGFCKAFFAFVARFVFDFWVNVVVSSSESPEVSSRACLMFTGLGAFAFCLGLRAISILEWAAFRAGLAISSSESPSPSRGAALAWTCFRNIDLGADSSDPHQIHHPRP